jgi:hypothetical protein
MNRLSWLRTAFAYRFRTFFAWLPLALFATIFPCAAKASTVFYTLTGVTVDGLSITGGFTLDSTASEPTAWDISVPADVALGTPAEQFATGGYNDSNAGNSGTGKALFFCNGVVCLTITFQNPFPDPPGFVSVDPLAPGAPPQSDVCTLPGAIGPSFYNAGAPGSGGCTSPESRQSTVIGGEAQVAPEPASLYTLMGGFAILGAAGGWRRRAARK